jgi:hypothetical protein
MLCLLVPSSFKSKNQCFNEISLLWQNTKDCVAYNRNLFLTVLEVVSPRLRSQHGRILVRTLFQVADYQLFILCILRRWKAERGSKLSHDSYRGPTLITSSNTYYLLIPSYGETEAQHVHLGGYKYSLHNGVFAYLICKK